MRRGQGNTLWILVVAIIALIAAAILIIIFTGRTGDADRSIKNCLGKGGTCEVAAEDGSCPTGDKLPLVSFTCPKNAAGKDQICCVG
tara:strand:- start:17787 stop:18047 length:261 start_codon:yes stop_codon:yes gene_type:complete